MQALQGRNGTLRDSGRILCYDEAEAARYLEFRLEDYAELAAAGEEGLEKPQSLEEAKGLGSAKT